MSKRKWKMPSLWGGDWVPPDSINYFHNKTSNIYYNNEKYNDTNKAIIGKLVLNDGQPCYQSNEKLWRKFADSEKDETHLSFTNIKVFNKTNDERYKKTGEIKYRKIYLDNLSFRAEMIILFSDIGDEKVSLYQREFFGIDKECDDKHNLTDDFGSLEKTQSIDRTMQLVEGIFILCNIPIFIVLEIVSICCLKEKMISAKVYFYVYMVYIFLICGFLVSHIIAYVKMINSDYSSYNCSDPITNEIIRQGNENNQKILTYNKLSVYPDVIILAGNLLVVIIGLIWDKIDKYLQKNKNYKGQNDNNTEEEIPYYAKYPSNE